MKKYYLIIEKNEQQLPEYTRQIELLKNRI